MLLLLTIEIFIIIRLKGTKTFFFLPPSDYIQFRLATKVELVIRCGSKDWVELFIPSFGAGGTSDVLRSQSRLVCVRHSRTLACTMRSCWELLPCCAARWCTRSRRRSGRPRHPRPTSLRRFDNGPVRSSPRPTPTPPSRTLWTTHTHTKFTVVKEATENNTPGRLSTRESS